MMQELTPEGMKLHLLNTEGESGGTTSPATHVVVTEQFRGYAGAPKLRWVAENPVIALKL